MQVSEDDKIGSEAGRFAIEAVAILVDVKTTAAGQLLRPAGVPEDLVQRFLSERNPTTRKKWTKRGFAVVLLDELARRGEVWISME